MQLNGEHWKNNLAIRDYLLLYPEKVAEYNDLKKHLLSEGKNTLLGFLKAKRILSYYCLQKIGVTGFEPATSASRRQRSTKLSYTPRTSMIAAPRNLIVQAMPAGKEMV